MAELFRGPCPYCGAIVALNGTPAQVTPATFTPEKLMPATIDGGLVLVSPPTITPTPTDPAPPVTDPFPAPSLIKRLKGVQPKFDTRTSPLAAGTLVDARGASWKLNDNNPINWAFKGKGRWLGGEVIGPFNPLTFPWVDGYHSQAGNHVRGEEPVVEGLVVENYGDGIRFNDPVITKPFTLRWPWFRKLRDDSFENDWLKSGLVEDFLFDEVYVGFSIRPGLAQLATVDGRNQTLTMRRGLIRLQRFPLTAAVPNTSGGFIKAENREPEKNVKLVFEDLIFRADTLPGTGDLRLNPHGIATAKNCVVVWLGAGPYPNLPLPVGWTLTTDVKVWDEARSAHLVRRAAWLTSLPAAA